MLKKIYGRINNKEGSILIFAVFIIAILIGATGLVVDSGIAYANKLHLQKAANAAALSGAQVLVTDKNESEEIIQKIMNAHNVDLNNVIYIIEDKRITVYAKKTNETIFMKIFGQDSVTVSAQATAILASKYKGKGAAPIGIDVDIDLTIGQAYTLKFDEANHTNGWFGILRIDGNGASVYEDTFINGANRTLAIGDIVDIQSGNVAGKTRNAVNAKINACDHTTTTECIENDCERMILVPIYESYPSGYTGVLSQVEIVGFAYFYLLEADGSGKSITGQFVARSEPGFGDEYGSDFGAYTIRLK